MNLSIPNELFNCIEPPSDGQTAVRIVDYIQTIVSNLPNCSDILIERELWNIVNDFCFRTGALREKKTGTLDASTHDIIVTTPSYGEFQRFVGAGVGSVPSSVLTLSAAYDATGPKVTFPSDSTGTGYVTYSVVPDINALHDKTPTTSGGATTYPNDKWILPKWFLRMYDKALVSGVCFKLFGMTQRPWSDYNMARSHALVYNREINRVTHGLITSGMRKTVLNGIETAFISATQNYGQQTQETKN